MTLYAIERNGKFLVWNSCAEVYEWSNNIHPDGLFVEKVYAIDLIDNTYLGSILREYTLTENTNPRVALALVV